MQSLEELTVRRETLVTDHRNLMAVVASVQASQDFRDKQRAKRIQDELLHMEMNAMENRATMCSTEALATTH